MTNHQISHADSLLRGNASLEVHKARYDGRRGHLAHMPSYKLLGAAALIVANALVNAATGAQLPNANTITYTTATDAVAPMNGASKPTIANILDNTGVSRSVWPLDVPRNVKLTVTHGSSIVALSLLVTGFDEYGAQMSETLAVTATGTTKTAVGKKAFKSILSYAFTSAGNATTDTAGLAWDNSLGLPYRISDASQAVPFGNALIDITGTVTAADDTSPATSITGDVRGTYLPSAAADGTKKYAVWIIPADPSVAQPLGLFGNPQV